MSELRADDERVTALIESLCDHTRALKLRGAPRVLRIPGRAGWELRLTVQSALCVLEQTRALGAYALQCRPTLRRRDTPRLLWQCLKM